MSLYAEIIACALQQYDRHVSFSEENLDLNELTSNVCYQAIQEIQAILQDDALSDPECFAQIEAIVDALEDRGISCTPRHDFG